MSFLTYLGNLEQIDTDKLPENKVSQIIFKFSEPPKKAAGNFRNF